MMNAQKKQQKRRNFHFMFQLRKDNVKCACMHHIRCERWDNLIRFGDTIKVIYDRIQMSL